MVMFDIIHDDYYLKKGIVETRASRWPFYLPLPRPRLKPPLPRPATFPLGGGDFGLRASIRSVQPVVICPLAK